jgi:hypothetical protein
LFRPEVAGYDNAPEVAAVHAEPAQATFRSYCMVEPALRSRRQPRAARQHRFVWRLLGLAAAGFVTGFGFGAALLSADIFGLGTLVAAETSPLFGALLFTGGLGILLMPASLATGLAKPGRAAGSDRHDATVAKGRHP